MYITVLLNSTLTSSQRRHKLNITYFYISLCQAAQSANSHDNSGWWTAHLVCFSSYILTLPSQIRPGLELKVLVNVFNATRDVSVNVELWKGGQPNAPIEPLPVFGRAEVPVQPPPPPGRIQPVDPQPPKKPQLVPSEEKILERRATVQTGRPVTISLQVSFFSARSNRRHFVIFYSLPIETVSCVVRRFTGTSLYSEPLMVNKLQ